MKCKISGKPSNTKISLRKKIENLNKLISIQKIEMAISHIYKKESLDDFRGNILPNL